MTDLKKAAQQALEALEATHYDVGSAEKQRLQVMDAITALRAALAQQEQKRFGYIWPTGRHPEFRYTQLYTAPPRRETEQEPDLRNANPIGLTPPQKALQQAQFRADSLAQEEQEPVAWTDRELELIDGMIEVQLRHAAQCDAIANRPMAEKQKGWDMERVALLHKIKSISPRREWRGLTMQEINALPEVGGRMWDMGVADAVLRAIRAIEAALKEKNNG